MRITGCDEMVLEPGEHKFRGNPLFGFVFAQWLQFFTSFGILSKDSSYRITIDTWENDSENDIEMTAGGDYRAFRVAMANAMQLNAIRSGRVNAVLPDATVELSVDASDLSACNISVVVPEGCKLSLSEFSDLLNAAEDEVTKQRNNSF